MAFSNEDSTPKAHRPRRPYRAPLILSRELLEVMAASCGTPGGKPDPIMCPSGPIQS